LAAEFGARAKNLELLRAIGNAQCNCIIFANKVCCGENTVIVARGYTGEYAKRADVIEIPRPNRVRGPMEIPSFTFSLW
jgi:hypothetical protein